MTVAPAAPPAPRPVTLAELAEHKSETDLWVSHKGRVYNVTQFANDHPGGADLILEYAGQEIDQVMADADIHEHSDGAYDMLAEYYVGPLVKSSKVKDAANAIIDPVSPLDEQLTAGLASAKRPLLDLSKPLVWQMLTSTFSKDYYLTQVHIPRHLPEPAYLFGNPVLEVLTRTPWYVVPLTWTPVVAYLAWSAAQVFPLETVVSMFLAGLVMWSFFEYTFHRFLFHIDTYLPDHPYALTLHFLTHGIHHYLPMDRMRLVLPPIFFAIIVQPPWFAFRAILDFPTCAGLFSGGIAGYIIYDLTHYYLHHARVRTGYLRDLKKYHLAHHYKEYNEGFGITSKAWDYVFGTVLDYTDVKSGKRKTA
ncbi:fatty acid alpha-hydroxylase [Allomyces javanicus]|nr:fatty acid alpha-hydroxylase [Allomyces javanicus]